MASKVKPRTLNKLHTTVGTKLITKNEAASAGAHPKGIRRRVSAPGQHSSSAGVRTTMLPSKPVLKQPQAHSAGSVRSPHIQREVHNGGPSHGESLSEPDDGCDLESTEQDVRFFNVPSAWEKDNNSESRPTSATSVSSKQEVREISMKAVLFDAQETDVSRVFEIDLHASHIGCIKNLDKFTRVRVLDLSCNRIAAIENLHNNLDLRELKLYDNLITCIQHIDNLKSLCILQLQHNKITSIGKGLNGLKKLKVLRLDSNELTRVDVRELASCSSITSLNLCSNRLDNISAVSCLPNLEELDVSYNRLRSVGDLSRCKKLQEINLSHNRIGDASGVKGLPNLKILHLNHNLLTNMKSVGKTKCLEEMFVSHNRLTDVSNFVQLFPSLQILDLADNCIEDWELICGLNGLNELVELTVSGNPFCQENGTKNQYQNELHKLLPHLDVLDSMPLRRPASRGGAPLMRPMSANAVVSSKQVETQIKSLESDIDSFELDFAKRFDSLRATMNALPAESPSSPRPVSTALSTTTNSARPPSRAGKRSRINDALQFAAQQTI